MCVCGLDFYSDCCGSAAYFGRHVLTVLLCGVDESLIQIHHKNQLPVSVEPLLVFSAKLLGLLFTTHTHTSTITSGTTS